MIWIFSPLFCSVIFLSILTQTFPLLPCFPLRAYTPTRPELSGLSYLTLITLHSFYSGRSHEHDSTLFLDADTMVETLQNHPEWNRKSEY